MNKSCYFYSFATSPYIHVCCFHLKQNDKNYYIYVQLRNSNGSLIDGVEIRDMGATLSNDYTIVGYHFNNVKPLFVI
jgi:hypothetical protein